MSVQHVPPEQSKDTLRAARFIARPDSCLATARGIGSSGWLREDEEDEEDKAAEAVEDVSIACTASLMASYTRTWDLSSWNESRGSHGSRDVAATGCLRRSGGDVNKRFAVKRLQHYKVGLLYTIVCNI